MSQRLAKTMLTGTGLSHPCDNPQLIETHISWLVLAGEFAYKIKKPVDLGFVDFTTLYKRRLYCEAEVRLNRRTAPDIYLEVISISGTEDQPVIAGLEDGHQAPFEYAVKMRRFPNEDILARLAAKGKLDGDIILKLAGAIADFHESIKSEFVDPGMKSTAMDRVKQPADDNFAALMQMGGAKGKQVLLATLRGWSDNFLAAHMADFAQRAQQGAVRECHGDLHLANIFFNAGKCTLFDCIEFSEELRWIDVANDIAFTVMDLHHHGEPNLAHQLINDYLQHTGDYDSLTVMVFYLVYRAMVRAKVAGIRAGQDPAHGDDLSAECMHYLELANSFTLPRARCLIMMSGLSGAGKTTVGRQLAAELGAIHIRSDVERKRLFGLGLTESSQVRGIDIYNATANDRTFGELERLAGNIVRGGYPVVVDATFIHRGDRDRFEALAAKLDIPWGIVECTCDEETTRERLRNRHGDASEAGFEQYLDQREQVDSFNDQELRHRVVVDTTLTTILATRVPRDALAMALRGHNPVVV